MRRILPLFLIFLSIQAWSQSACSPKSTLFQFDPQMKPRVFTEKLGNHPQFPFLQQVNGVVTRAAFLKAVKDPGSRKRDKMEFGVFNELLKEIGFAGGYRDLKLANVENLYINPGTIGNLGFFNKENGYIYVRLDPAGEGEDGIAAWRVTGPEGCYFYILHTCGNAFFANDPAGAGSGCCRDLTVNAQTDTVAAVRSRNRPLHIDIRFYQARVTAGKNRSDTAYQLIRSIDTNTTVTDTASMPGKLWGKGVVRNLLCRDTVLSITIPLAGNETAGPDSLCYVLADTVFVRSYSGVEGCREEMARPLCARGGIGRRARLRALWTDVVRGGSSPLGRIKSPANQGFFVVKWVSMGAWGDRSGFVPVAQPNNLPNILCAGCSASGS